jgi:hypothetical protein
LLSVAAECSGNVYLNEHADAEETQRSVEAEGRRFIRVAGDVADPRFCEVAVAKPCTRSASSTSG